MEQRNNNLFSFHADRTSPEGLILRGVWNELQNEKRGDAEAKKQIELTSEEINTVHSIQENSITKVQFPPLITCPMHLGAVKEGELRLTDNSQSDKVCPSAIQCVSNQQLEQQNEVNENSYQEFLGMQHSDGGLESEDIFEKYEEIAKGYIKTNLVKLQKQLKIASKRIKALSLLKMTNLSERNNSIKGTISAYTGNYCNDINSKGKMKDKVNTRGTIKPFGPSNPSSHQKQFMSRRRKQAIEQDLEQLGFCLDYDEDDSEEDYERVKETDEEADSDKEDPSDEDEEDSNFYIEDDKQKDIQYLLEMSEVKAEKENKIKEKLPKSQQQQQQTEHKKQMQSQENKRREERLKEKAIEKERIKNIEQSKKLKRVKIEEEARGGVATVEVKPKKRREREDIVDDSEEAKVTISLPQQFELLKYHKRSKNYFGTAKQFGISHQQARAIVKIHKDEFKKLPSY